MEVIMKKRDVVLRISLLGLVAVVLGTAAAMGGSEGGMVPEVAEASAKEGVATRAPRALKLPEEMTEEEKVIFEAIAALRNPRGITVQNPDSPPYGCEIEHVLFMGTAWRVLLDDWVDHSQPNLWKCWVEGYNEENAPPADSIALGDDDGSTVGSLRYHADEEFYLWWGLYRGESLLGYCAGNVYDCGGYWGDEKIFDGYWTCEESLVVVLWDHRNLPAAPLLFWFEQFDDVPWDEYGTCS